MARKIKAKATSVMTAQTMFLSSEILYFLSIYNIGPIAMWAKELVA